MRYHRSVAAPKAVIDTNVLVAALLKREGDNRRIIRACLEGHLEPLIGQNLFLEYEDVLGRPELFQKCLLSARERQSLVDAFLSTCKWVQVFYLWRPNLRDEGDNHVLELAVAGGASLVLTHNVADFSGSDLRFPDVRILRPKDFLKELP